MVSILTYFERTVSMYPDKIAVEDRDRKYSFRALETIAKQMGYAISRSVSVSRAIGVLVNRGADTTALFLSVLYAGCYYVPIDPQMPIQKISTILSDCNASMLLGSEENQELVNQLDYQGIFWTLDQASDQQAEIPCSDEQTPLYMIYTSGSTGRPKGVLKSHGAMISYMDAFLKTFSIDASDVIGNQTPFYFDASAKDLYLMLFSGAKLEVIPSELFIFPTTLVDFMNQRRITYICWVPTALALVTQMNTFRKFLPETLKKVFFVGEVFPMKQLRKWVSALPLLQYVNLYGSSEIAGICCYFPVTTDSLAQDHLPIGKPLCNCQVFLKSKDGFISEPEKIGEVYIASDALATCYYNDPQRTADCFFSMALPDGESKRVFRTGDLARYDAQGNLVFSSRKDFQIKHMGRRIELGEIEAAADSLVQIQRCCCIYDEKWKTIKLFCELTPGYSIEGKEIIHSLSDKISEYMLPSKVIILEKLPINPNGKIDRTALKETK